MATNSPAPAHVRRFLVAAEAHAAQRAAFEDVDQVDALRALRDDLTGTPGTVMWDRLADIASALHQSANPRGRVMVVRFDPDSRADCLRGLNTLISEAEAAARVPEQLTVPTVPADPFEGLF